MNYYSRKLKFSGDSERAFCQDITTSTLPPTPSTTPFFIPIIPHQDGAGLETPEPPAADFEEVAKPATLTGIIGLPTITPAPIDVSPVLKKKIVTPTRKQKSG